MAGRFADLDALLAEVGKTRTPDTLRLFGQDWELPTSVPALLILRLEQAKAYAAARAEAADDENAVADTEVPDTEGLDVLTVSRTVCGEANVDAWLEKGIDDDGLWWAVHMALAIHRGYDETGTADNDGDQDGDGEGKPAAPKAGRSSTSSKRSPSSKRTSSGSTGSTSRKNSGG